MKSFLFHRFLRKTSSSAVTPGNKMSNVDKTSVGKVLLTRDKTSSKWNVVATPTIETSLTDVTSSSSTPSKNSNEQQHQIDGIILPGELN